MTRRLGPKALLTGLIVALASCGSGGTRAQPGYLRVAVAVGSRPAGQPLAPGFVGLSLEYSAVQPYATPAAIGLIRDLSPGQRPVLRIGGNSSDETWWPQRGRATPRGAEFALSKGWLATTRAFAASLNARLILDLNLAGDQPAVAASEAAAFVHGLGSSHIAAFEIGNEPDLYGLFPWYKVDGRTVRRRPAGYSLGDLVAQFSRWRAAIGQGLPVTGPAYATFDWSLARFIGAEPGLGFVTFHHYPLDACLTKRSASGYATIASLLSDRASGGFARQLAPAVAVAHADHVRFRLDELNSASCGGKPGVSNTFASALWILDTLFNLASVSVDGVNVHTFSGAAYAPFGPTQPNPEYYGMLMFTEAFPPGARLLPVSVSPAGPLKAWATETRGHAIKVVLINKDPARSYLVKLRVRGLAGGVRLERLRAPSVSATDDVTLGGRQTISPTNGLYSITVPAASAVLLN